MVVAALWLSGHGHAVRLPYALPVALSLVAGALGGLAAGGGLLALVQDLFLFGWAVAVANLGPLARAARHAGAGLGAERDRLGGVLLAGVLVHVVLAVRADRAGRQPGLAHLRRPEPRRRLLPRRAARAARRAGCRGGGPCGCCAAR